MSYTINPDGSGTGRIVFQNLMSMEAGDGDVSVQDYGELITSYVQGNRFGETNPGLDSIATRLFEKDGALFGEVTFTFTSYNAVGLYRFNGLGPFMFHVGSTSDVTTERFESSNGTLGGDKMPVVFWPDTTTSFTVVASIQEPEPDTHSLLPLYRRYGLKGADK